jgi:hypothetical protein
VEISHIAARKIVDRIFGNAPPGSVRGGAVAYLGRGYYTPSGDSFKPCNDERAALLLTNPVVRFKGGEGEGVVAQTLKRK